MCGFTVFSCFPAPRGSINQRFLKIEHLKQTCPDVTPLKDVSVEIIGNDDTVYVIYIQ